MRYSLNEINAEYDAVSTDPWGVDWRGTMALRNRFYSSTVVRTLKQADRPPAGLDVLDIGCGSGILTEQLFRSISQSQPVKRYVAVDVSTSAIARAKSLHPHSQIDYRTVSDDLADLDGETFDVILGFEFLPYIGPEDRQALFQQLRSLCRPSAPLFLSSNVCVGNPNRVYLASEQLESEIAEEFACLKRHDMFISYYVDIFEQRLLRLQNFRHIDGLIRWALSKQSIPVLFHLLAKTLSHDRWPRKRNRTFVLKGREPQAPAIVQEQYREEALGKGRAA
jgi:2-polyprenyl-3-methyl-5-hydroxy-6-metoxy-1,4-benzoquinol methylase